MKHASEKKSKNSITPSSGNVFADLQLPDAEEKQTKVRLAVAINQIIESARLSQAAASEALKGKSAENFRAGELSVGRMFRGKTDEFSQCARAGCRNRNPQGTRKKSSENTRDCGMNGSQPSATSFQPFSSGGCT
jgi:predicted XRE-type DNA-binding protein